MRSALLLFAFCALRLTLNAQPLTAYTDLQQQVMVWDNGLLRKVDYLSPTDMKIGRVAIPYLDNSRSFKIYYGGGVRTLNPGFTNAFRASDNLVAFLNAKSLNVFDRGQVKNLSLLCSEWYMGDSIVVFLDDQRTEYKAYYNGAIYPIESYLAGNAVQGVKVSDNIAAYNNYANQFRIFYGGRLLTQEANLALSWDVGRNTVAYTDAGHVFKIFHNGRTFTEDGFQPISYTVGDDLVAYVTNDGYFKIFYNDSTYNIGFFRPDYVVGDHVVGFRDVSGYFKVFFKGEITTLDSYYPSSYTVQYNSLAYVNQAGVLRLFSNGEVNDITTTNVDSWDLNYDVLKYRVGDNFYRIYYNGQEY